MIFTRPTRILAEIMKCEGSGCTNKLPPVPYHALYPDKLLCHTCWLKYSLEQAEKSTNDKQQ